jgi:hypothetical protein
VFFFSEWVVVARGRCLDGASIIVRIRGLRMGMSVLDFGGEGRGYFKFICLFQFFNEGRGGKGRSSLFF